MNKSRHNAIIFDKDSSCWMLLNNPIVSFYTCKISEIKDILNEIEKLSKRKGLFAVGFVSYEAAPAFDGALKVKSQSVHKHSFPLVSFKLFKNIEIVKSICSKEAYNEQKLIWQSSISKREYISAVNKIKFLIQSGDTYQVNYTIRLKANCLFDPFQFFLAKMPYSPPPYTAFILERDWGICSFSPELFFEYADGKIISRPMKGTRERGLSIEEDLLLRKELEKSEKDRAENVMIVDMVRNDLAKIALNRTVKVTKLFEIEQYPTVWQMTSTVQAKTHASLSEILSAMFPAASITGAPKARTMEIISELEDSPRKIYTGTIGWLSPDGKMRFNVAIRTALINTNDETAEYGVGGGIVWDSDPNIEFEECKNKAALLFCEPIRRIELLETILFNGKTRRFSLLKEHVERMAASARYFTLPFRQKTLLEAIKNSIKGLVAKSYKIRITLDREGKISCMAIPLVVDKRDVLLKLAKEPVNSNNLFLYHKTTHREVYEKAKKQLSGCDDVLLWNEKGEITETTIANIIYEFKGGNKKFTPPVSCGLLAGTARSILLKKKKIEERILKIEELPMVSKLWVINSVRGINRAKLISYE